MNSSKILLLIILSYNLSFLYDQDTINQKYREFDFWIGEWNVYKHNTDTLVGKSKIERIIDGKAIKETYHSVSSKYHGTSITKYNPRTDQWEQFWVDNTGLTLHIIGNLQNEAMILQNEIKTQKEKVANKIKWTKNSNNTVRQTWLQYKNQNQTWKVIFDGEYRKK